MNRTATALEESPGQNWDHAFGGAVAAPEDGHVTVYWHGALTSAARAAIAQSAVPVVVKPARYSKKVLEAAGDAVMQQVRSAAIGVESVTVQYDGSGLEVSLVGGDADVARLRQAVSSVGVPVTAAGGGEVGTVLADTPSRRNDQSAGGAAMVGPICSTAFAINIRGRDEMLTADHCFPNGYGNDRYGLNEQDTQGRLFGTRSSSQIKYPNGEILDVAAIAPKNGATFEPRMWRGAAFHATGSQHKAYVAAAAKPQKGNWVCNDGARSGETCNIKIVGRVEDYEATGPDGTKFYKWGWKAASPDKSVAVARRGDSGGPVVLGANNGQSSGGDPGDRVTAVGVVSASTGKTWRCGGTTCASGFFFVGIDDALESLDASIQTHDPRTGKTVLEHFDKKDPAPATAPDLDPTVHVELVGRYGKAWGLDGGYVGLPRGDSKAQWELLPQSDGGWWFRNVANNQVWKPATGSYQFALNSGDNGHVHIGHDGACADLDNGSPSKGWVAKCDFLNPYEDFEVVPVGEAFNGQHR
ncbi:chymotrypsin family serine protease [Streptomyces gibsoniae]|uniref:Serine protease n=1 Tax=Streptomyces gibsoniae TaxID=3075529 RepID=A0ABU2U9H7_9ACTN|nr:hypothetical protein [Streptomyces sp. DSM 41699]MDT0469896.1 hypothetical protein [Streptomyces sp. DSM 41699]